MSRTYLRFLVALVALLASCAWADSQARIVRLSYIDGQVQFDRNDGQGFGQAFLNSPVIEGSRLSTGSDGHAEVEFEDGSTARLIPNTIVAFQELRRGENGTTRSLLVLEQGEAYFNAKNSGDFLVQAGSESFSPVKKSHFRVSSGNGEAALAVFNGDVQAITPSGQRVAVKKHESLALSFGDADRYFLAQSVPLDPQDDWDSQRDSYVGSQGPNLSQYGSYMTVNNYGTVWRPYGIGYDWDPYSSGSWASYPGCGYVWVSSYPWGWAPYRYGSWAFIPGIGWAWQPGLSGWGWNTGPVFVSTPVGFVPPAPPRNPVGVVVVGTPPRVPIWHPRGGTPINTYATSPAAPVTVGSTAVATTAVSPRPERPVRDTGIRPAPTAQPVGIQITQSAARPVAPMRAYTPPPQRTFSPPPMMHSGSSTTSTPSRPGRSPR